MARMMNLYSLPEQFKGSIFSNSFIYMLMIFKNDILVKFDRWDLSEIEQLPEYMKVCYMALYNTNNEICDKVLKERGLSVQPFLRNTVTFKQFNNKAHRIDIHIDVQCSDCLQFMHILVD